MKMIRISEQSVLSDLLRDAAEEDVVLLDEQGRPRFAIVATAERAMDFDEEVRALRANPKFMAALDEWSERARTEHCVSLEAICEANEALDKLIPEVLGRLTEAEAREILEKIGIPPAKYGMDSAKQLLDRWQHSVYDLTESESTSAKS